MIEQRPQFCQRIIAVAIHHFAAQPFSGEAAGPTARGNIVEGLISKVIPQFNLRQGGVVFALSGKVVRFEAKKTGERWTIPLQVVANLSMRLAQDQRRGCRVGQPAFL